MTKSAYPRRRCCCVWLVRSWQRSRRFRDPEQRRATTTNKSCVEMSPSRASDEHEEELHNTESDEDDAGVSTHKVKKTTKTTSVTWIFGLCDIAGGCGHSGWVLKQVKYETEKFCFIGNSLRKSVEGSKAEGRISNKVADNIRDRHRIFLTETRSAEELYSSLFPTQHENVTHD